MALQNKPMWDIVLCDSWMGVLPFGMNQNHKVVSSVTYDTALRQRGSAMVRVTAKAIEAWRAAPRTTPGGQPWYLPPAVLAGLALQAVFRLALRRTEGLIGSYVLVSEPRTCSLDKPVLNRKAT